MSTRAREILFYIFLVRQQDATGRSKRARPIYDPTLMAWRETKHHPVLAEFSLPHNWWPSRPRSMRYDRKAMLEAYNLANLGSTRYTHFERDAAQQLSTCMDAAYDDITASLVGVCAYHFPVARQSFGQPWSHPLLAGSIRRMWMHYKAAQTYRSSSTQL